MNKSIVIACSGPSLNAVDIYTPELPIAAISTAIQSVIEPDYWIFTDRGCIVASTNEATTNGAIGDLCSIHYVADAELVA